jgi:hypothetical protein
MMEISAGFDEGDEFSNRLADLLPAGPPISEEQQIGRASGIADCERRIRHGEVLKVLEQRRCGKTSFARSAVNRVASRGGLTADLNLRELAGPEHAARELANQLAPGWARLGAGPGGLRDLARRLAGADKAAGDDSEAGAILRAVSELLGDHANAQPDISTVLRRAASRAKRRGGAILFDEAHVIGDWPQEPAFALGATLRNLSDLGVVIASSEQHALELLTAEGQPLEFVGRRYPLPPIVREDWEVGLAGRFARLGVPIEPDALKLLLDESRGQPWCTMALAHESARIARETDHTTVAVVRTALIRVAKDEAWQRLR